MISNKAQLIRNGSDGPTRRARRLILDALEFTLASVNPHTLVSHGVKRRGDRLRVEGQDVSLGAYDRIFVVGAGKASGAMAEALEAILGNRLTGGLVVVPSGQEQPKLGGVRFVAAPHPTPDTNSVNAAKALVTLVEELNSRDLLICLISGGGSALLSLPIEPLTIEDKGNVARLLMNAGANIVELNTVRKHLSKIKGGWLAKRSHAGKILGLIISDVVGDRLDSIASGPISPDTTTYPDAIAVLKRYGLWEKIPDSAAKILTEGADGSIPESPKSGDLCFSRVSSHILGSNRIACSAAKRYLQSRGVKAEILTSSVTGEARHLGSFIGSMAREIALFNEPLRRPSALVLGGETTVTVTGSGRGGRNQECTMTCAEKIQGLKGVAMASIGSDGIDGPTDAAGAIADGMTVSRARQRSLKFDELLAQNDSYEFFKPLKDLVMTGRTNTNVNDIALLVSL